MPNFLQRIQCLTEDDTVSAQRAVDFYEGDQTRLMREILNNKGRGITHWHERGVMTIWVNYVLDIIRQSSHTYDSQPKREVFTGEDVNESITDLYNNLLIDAGFEFASQGLDELSRLLKSTLLFIQWVPDKNKYNFVLLGRHNSHVEWDSLTGTVKSLMYATCDAGLSGGQMFRHITPDTVTEIEFFAGDGVTSDRVKSIDETNPYGIIPVAPLFDVRIPSTGFYGRPAWEDLVSFNAAKNMFHIEAKFGSRFGLLGMPVTNAKIADGTVMSPDAIIQVVQTDPDIPIFFEFRAPQVQIDEFLPWLDGLTRDIGRSWGVTFEADGAGSADSGFKLIVKELPNTELRQTRRKAALQFEQELFNTLRIMHSVDSPSAEQIPNEAKLKVEFTAPLNVVNEKEVHDIAKEDLALGTLSKVEYIMKRDKVSREDAEAKLVIIDAERAIVGTAPEFDE